MTGARDAGRYLLVAGSAFAALLVAEAAVRLAPAGSRVALQAAPRALPGNDFMHLMEPDPDPAVSCRLRAGQSATLLGEPVTTNSLGFRGPELADRSWQVVAIGDSITFGWGVRDDATFCSVLQRSLRQARPDAEVVNLGVPSYNTSQEVALLERHLPRLHPSWVVLTFDGNDFQPGGQYVRRQSPIERHSYLARLLMLRIDGWRHREGKGPDSKRTFDALRRLGELSKEHRFRVLLLVYASFVDPGPAQDFKATIPRPGKAGAGYVYVAGAVPHPQTTAIAREQGFVVLTLEEILARARAAGEIQGFLDIWLHPTPPVDPHPSVLGHRLLGEAMAGIVGAEQ